MLEENDTINRLNLFNYPILEDKNFHYRGQLRKFNKVFLNYVDLFLLNLIIYLNQKNIKIFMVYAYNNLQ